MLAAFWLRSVENLSPQALVDHLFVNRRFAVVAVPLAKEISGYMEVSKDEVRLANFARKTWGLDVKLGRGTARAMRLEKPDFFTVHAGGDVVYPVTLADLSKRGGARCRVGDFLKVVAPKVTAHSLLMRRRIWMRVDADRIEDALPAVAYAIGGTWDLKQRRIDFDPAAYRAALLESLDVFAPYKPNWPHEGDLIRFALSLVDDDDLTDIFRAEKTKIVWIPFEMTAANRRALDPFLVKAYNLTAKDATMFGGQVQRAIDEGWSPSIRFNSNNGVLLELRSAETGEMVAIQGGR